MLNRRRLRAAAGATIGALLIVGVLASPASADTNVSVPLQVNFQSQGAPTPTGYTADYGQAYDANRGYGWTNTSGVPTSLVGNGRDRNVDADQRLDTLINMQLAPGSAGVSTPGAWKAAVANGAYQVTLAAGDASYIDSRHVLRVEGQTAIDFTPTGTNKFVTQTVTANVTDGFLNIDAIGGTNTKINYLDVKPATATGPTVTDVDPANNTTGASRSQSVTVRLSNGVQSPSLDAGLKLIDPNGNSVAGFRNTDGAFSNATFSPSTTLAANTTYRVQVTADLKASNGDAYTPFTSQFTTGTSGDPTAPVDFNRSVFSSQSGVTALAINPERTALFAAVNTGAILRYSLDSEGKPVGTPTEINTYKFQRIIIGLKFDPASTAANPKLWVSGGAYCQENCADFTGKVSVLTGSDLSTSRDVITGLPRSVKDHMTNGIEFGPDGKMYIAQGSNSGFGAPDADWGFRSENPLNATVLVADVNNDSRFNSTVNVSTASGNNYNPDASTAPVKIFAQGIRNPYSLTWHTNGKLYAPVNASSSGTAPAGPNNTPPGLENLPSYNDYFTQVVQGKYYGHPNPSRGFYRLNGANPTSGTDPFQVSEYPVGTQPDANWRQPDLNLGQHRSANGSVEFKSNAFGSNLQGQILVTEYSQGKDVIALKTDGNGNVTGKTQVASGFYNPLAITSDPVTGRTYVSEYGRDPDGVGGQITLMTPAGGTTTPPPSGDSVKKVNFGTATTQAPTGYVGDYGQAYNATRGYGWETVAGAPLDLTQNGRERNKVADKRLDSFMHMNFIGSSGGTKTEGRWQLDIPNGTYPVTVGVGDPDYADSQNVIRAEGNVIGQFTPTATERNKVFTATVTVTDGKLTIDQTGGSNTKIDYIDVNTGNTTPPPTSSTVAKVNFGTATTQAPTGYTADYGQAFATTRGYGWQTPAGQPLDITQNGRERNAVADKRLDSFMHMAFNGPTGGVKVEGRWELVVPNGTYKVTVGVGDPSYADSSHLVRAEGQTVVAHAPTTAVPNKIGTVDVAVTDGRLTLDQTGGTNTKIDFVDVETADGTPAPVDTTAPEVNIAPAGTTNASGAYINKATVTVNATDAGSGVANVSYTLDGAPAAAYNQPFEVTTPGNHTVTATATDKAGNTSAVVTKTFTVVAQAPTAQNVNVATPQEYLGLGKRVVFTTVANKTQPIQNITLSNPNTGAANVNLAIAGTNATSFALAPGQANNITIPAGGNATVALQFVPKVVESNQAVLNVTTAGAAAAQQVTLGGMNAREFEDVNEPSLQAITDALGYKINAGVTFESTNFISKSNGPVGDEILAPYFKRADNSRPVNLYPLANYSGRATFAKGPFGFNNKNTASAANPGYYFPGGSDMFGGENQKLLPGIASGNTTAWTNPTAAFGVRDGNGGSVAYSDDNLNGSAKLHNFRMYPAKDAAGTVIPNTYIVGDDIGTADCCFKNFDYQDYVFLVTNVSPENAPAVAGPAPGDASLNLNFSSSKAGTVAGTGFTSVQANNAGNQLDASRITLDTSDRRLAIRSTAGTSSQSTNNQVNALQSAFNASTGKFRVATRMEGPFSFLNVENEQQAVFFGPDQNNYLKAEVEYGGGQPVLTIWLEQNGTGQIVRRIPFPTPGVNASTVDFYLDGDADAKTFDVLYSINGGTATKLNTNAIAVPATWFSVNTPAGILVSHANGQEFAGEYNSFAITKR